jgi:hypothetical protein
VEVVSAPEVAHPPKASSANAGIVAVSRFFMTKKNEKSAKR